MRRALVAYLVGSAIVWAIASAGFVRVRNDAFEQREGAAQWAALTQVKHGHAAPHMILGGIVSPPQAEPRHPFLRHRDFTPAAGVTRRLGGPEAPPDEKLVSDAAARARPGDFSYQVLEDGRSLATNLLPSGDVVVVLAEPQGHPAPFPWLFFALLFAAGAVVVAVGARFGWPLLGVGLALPVIAALVWGVSVWAIVAILVAAGLALLGELAGLIARIGAALRRHRVAYAYVFPAAAGMAVLVLAPFAIGCVLGFYDHAHGEWHYVGLKNFVTILSGEGRALDDPLNFWFTLAVTIAWTLANVALHVTIGTILALALREKWMRARGIYRVLLILPWAVPNYITALIWRGMFQRQFGAINALFHAIGLPTVSWFSHFATSFCANVVTNTWLGFPFMMVVALGALESIPRDLYEAASVDGASAWSRFVHITLPNLRPAMIPAVVLGSIWTFNMFNVIYLVSNGKPGGATDILITQAYRWAFERGERYGMAAAYAMLIFLILLGWTVLGNRLRRKSPEAA